MTVQPPVGGDAGDAGEAPLVPYPNRRTNRDRRTNNRRRDDPALPPPYFETFDRIAAALENIEQLLRRQTVTLPDAGREAPVRSQ